MCTVIHTVPAATQARRPYAGGPFILVEHRSNMFGQVPRTGERYLEGVLVICLTGTPPFDFLAYIYVPGMCRRTQHLNLARLLSTK